MLPAFRTILRNSISQLLTDDAFLDEYFGTLDPAAKKQYQLDLIDAKIAAVQADIDNIDDFVAAYKTQVLAEKNQLKTLLNAFRAYWLTTP